jgi:N-acetylglutamate synthase-like GNAT family acetyltransferase
VETGVVGPDSIGTIAALAARSLLDAPTEDELRAALLAPDQPATVRGDPERGVVASVTRGDHGFVRFLAVDPACRNEGRGRALLAAAEADLRAAGARSVTVGADAPHYLWAGVDTHELAAICLLERARYRRVEANFNMDVDLAALPPDPGGWRVATATDRAAVDAWAVRHWDFWRDELVRALGQGGLVLTEAAGDITAVCAHDVTRAGFVGPVAVRPDLMRRGVGVAPLLGALHEMRRAGRTHAEVSWVGPVVPYARVGATIGRVFLVYRKELK